MAEFEFAQLETGVVDSGLPMLSAGRVKDDPSYQLGSTPK